MLLRLAVLSVLPTGAGGNCRLFTGVGAVFSVLSSGVNVTPRPQAEIMVLVLALPELVWISFLPIGMAVG